MTIEDRVNQLRKDYVEKPGMREIIKRQVRALELASGKSFMKLQPSLLPEDQPYLNLKGEMLPWEEEPTKNQPVKAGSL